MVIPGLEFLSGEAGTLILPLLALLAFSLTTPLIDYIGRRGGVKYLGGLWSLVSFIILLLLLYPLYTLVSREGVVRYHYLSGPPMGVEWRVDMLSIFLSYIFALLGFFATLHSLRYMEEDTGLDMYYTLLQLMVLGMIGVTYANDLFNLFVFWEIMAISSYVLVAFRKENWEAVEAAFKYLIMSSFGSVTLLFSISLLYGLTGTLNFEGLAKVLAGAPNSPIYYLVILLMLVAFGIKAAVVPFHTWLPDAHPAAPSPISAMLSGVVIKVGVYAMARTLFTFFPPSHYDYGVILLLLGFFTMTVANFMALLQEDIKRLLAYSSIVNIGFIATGLGLAAYILYSPGIPSIHATNIAVFAALGAFFHLLNHALGKGLLFLSSGSFIHRRHTRLIKELIGIGRRMPWTGVSFSMGLLSLAGVPPLAGFWGKMIIIWAAWQVYQAVGGSIALLAVLFLVFNSVFAAAYYLRLIQLLVVRKGEKEEKGVEAPLSMVIPVVLLALACLVIGLWPGLVIDLAREAAASLIGVFS